MPVDSFCFERQTFTAMGPSEPTLSKVLRGCLRFGQPGWRIGKCLEAWQRARFILPLSLLTPLLHWRNNCTKEAGVKEVLLIRVGQQGGETQPTGSQPCGCALLLDRHLMQVEAVGDDACLISWSGVKRSRRLLLPLDLVCHQERSTTEGLSRQCSCLCVISVSLGWKQSTHDESAGTDDDRGGFWVTNTGSTRLHVAKTVALHSLTVKYIAAWHKMLFSVWLVALKES